MNYSSFQSHFSTCPRCHLEVDQQRLATETVVCNHCGYTAELNMQKSLQQTSRKFLRLIISTVIFVAAAFIHVANWDRHSLTIIPLKIKSLLGISNESELHQMITICQERLKYHCIEDALKDLSQIQPGDTVAPYELGEIRRKTNNFSGAEEAYRLHFQRGGNSADAAFGLARVLEARGEFGEAQVYYTRALAAKPEAFQVTVIQNYVAMLMKAGKAQEARRVILEARKMKGPSADFFMAKEFSSL